MEEIVAAFKQDVENNDDASVGIAVIKALTEVIRNSSAQTFMGLGQEIQSAVKQIKESCTNLPLHYDSAAQVFRNIISMASDHQYADWRDSFVDNANKCLSDAENVVNLIPNKASTFLQHGMTIMTHGYDPMIFRVLQYAASSGRKFSIVITEAKPKGTGLKMYEALRNLSNLKVTLIPDSAAAAHLDFVDVILVGTDIVLQDGGILAPVGTYGICAQASIHKVPVYCVSETFKFMRKFVLGKNDMQDLQRECKFLVCGVSEEETQFTVGEFDFTPAHFITLILTEKGPMPPSAVTYELTKLFGVN